MTSLGICSGRNYGFGSLSALSIIISAGPRDGRAVVMSFWRYVEKSAGLTISGIPLNLILLYYISPVLNIHHFKMRGF